MKHRRGTSTRPGARDQLRSIQRLLLFAVAVCFSLAIVLFVRQISHTKANPSSLALDGHPFYLGWFVSSQQEPRPTLDLDPPPKHDLFRNSPMQIVMNKIANSKRTAHLRAPEVVKHFQDEAEHSIASYPTAEQEQEQEQEQQEQQEQPVEEVATVEEINEEVGNERQPPAAEHQLGDGEGEAAVVHEVAFTDDDPAVDISHPPMPRWYTVQSEQNRLLTAFQVYSHDVIQEVKACMGARGSICTQPYRELSHAGGKIFLAATARDKPGSNKLYDQLVDGLRHHPLFNLAEDVFEAEFIIVIATSDTIYTWGAFEPEKLIIIDDSNSKGLISSGDQSSTLRSDSWYLAYFKHNYVHKSEGLFQCYPVLASNHTAVYPLSEALVVPDSPRSILPLQQRHIDILFGHSCEQVPRHNSRASVRTWLQKYTAANPALVAELDVCDTARVQELMCQSKIVVLTNPTASEDLQPVLKAMSCGALVFTDWIHTPHPYPLTHKQHVVYYSLADEVQFTATIGEMLRSLDEAQRIADQGLMHVLSKHTTVSLLDYILRTAIPVREDSAPTLLPPEYMWTGEELVEGLDKQLCPHSLLLTS